MHSSYADRRSACVPCSDAIETRLLRYHYCNHASVAHEVRDGGPAMTSRHDVRCLSMFDLYRYIDWPRKAAATSGHTHRAGHTDERCHPDRLVVLIQVWPVAATTCPLPARLAVRPTYHARGIVRPAGGGLSSSRPRRTDRRPAVVHGGRSVGRSVGCPTIIYDKRTERDEGYARICGVTTRTSVRPYARRALGQLNSNIMTCS